MLHEDAQVVLDSIIELFPQWLPTERQANACLNKLRRFADADAMLLAVEEYYGDNTHRRTPNLNEIYIIAGRGRSSGSAGYSDDMDHNPNRIWTTPYYIICTQVTKRTRGSVGRFQELALRKPWPPDHEMSGMTRELKNIMEGLPEWMGCGGVWEIHKSEAPPADEERPDSWYRYQTLLHRLRLRKASGDWAKDQALMAKTEKSGFNPNMPDAIAERMTEIAPPVHTVGEYLPQTVEEAEQEPSGHQEQNDMKLAEQIQSDEATTGPNW